MEKTLAVIEDLVKKGIVKKYAVGGGIAAIFYIESILTYDIDIFFIPADKDQNLLALSSIYKYLKERGYQPEKEYITIEGIPVQFLPVFNELVEEAVNEAASTLYKDIETKVMKLEYLIAIMLQTNRPKDRERVIKALNEGKIDRALLNKILNKFELKTRLEKIMEMYNAD